jgi:muconolactone D-isomerase
LIFLVRIEESRLADLSVDALTALVEGNRVRGRKLHAAGVLRDMWRLPGQRASIAIWSAADADALDASLRSLPIWPYVAVEVTSLASHPMMEDNDATNAESRRPTA